MFLMCNEVIYSRTFNCLEGLYLNSLDMQSKYLSNEWSGCYYSKNYKAWLKEYCTIRMCSSRRSGHSFALMDLIKKYDLYGAVLFPNLKMAGIFKDRFTRTDRVNFASILNDTSPWLDLSSDIVPNFIALDCASFSGHVYHDLVYDYSSIILRDNQVDYIRPFFIFFIE